MSHLFVPSLGMCPAGDSVARACQLQPQFNTALDRKGVRWTHGRPPVRVACWGSQTWWRAVDRRQRPLDVTPSGHVATRNYGDDGAARPVTGPTRSYSLALALRRLDLLDLPAENLSSDRVWSLTLLNPRLPPMRSSPGPDTGSGYIAH